MSNKSDIDRLIEQLKKMDDSLDRIDKSLIRQECFSKTIQKQAKSTEDAVVTLKTKLEPVFNHIHVVNFIVKLGIVLISSSFAYDMMKWLVLPH